MAQLVINHLELDNGALVSICSKKSFFFCLLNCYHRPDL